MDRYLYFAIFEACDEGGYTVQIPDLLGCISEGDNIEEAIRNAKEALELHLFSLEEDGSEITKATAPEELKLKPGEFTVPIEVFMPSVREEMNNKAVNTTVTISRWLKRVAKEKNINLSSVLEGALKERLGLRGDNGKKV